MPNIYLVTLAFNMDQNGWTENFYRSADSALLAANFGGQQQDLKFLNIRSNQVTLFAVRARRVPGNPPTRESYIRYPDISAPGNSGRSGIGPPQNPNRDQADTALYVRWESNAATGPPAAPAKSRAMMLRGCPDDWVNWDANGKPIIANDIKRQFDRFTTLITGLGFLNQIRTPETSNPRILINSVQPKPGFPNRMLVTCQTWDNTLTQGDRVTFGLVPKRQLPYLVGSYPIQIEVPGTSFSVAYQMLQGQIFLPSMYARKLVYAYPAINDGEIVDFRSHKTGRPTERYVGRKSAVRVSH